MKYRVIFQTYIDVLYYFINYYHSPKKHICLDRVGASERSHDEALTQNVVQPRVTAKALYFTQILWLFSLIIESMSCSSKAFGKKIQ